MIDGYSNADPYVLKICISAYNTILEIIIPFSFRRYTWPLIIITADKVFIISLFLPRLTM